MSDLYDTDIVLWSEEQSERRLAAGERANERMIDWEHVIEEIEDVGGNAVRSVRSLLLQAILHELKVQGWPQSVRVEYWRGEARRLRVQAADEYLASMRRRLNVADIYAKACRARPDTIDGQPPLPVAPTCPHTLDELLGDAR